jgi:TolB-like protein/Tfp pilus assembly protein PilF/predicted Ser/Thr protein kinase
MPLSAGDKLGPYEILGRIGTGGMGAVYRALDSRLGREVAVKTLNGKHGDRFEREARAIAALNHPNICQLYDVGPNYLVMELIDGTPLKGPLQPERAVVYAGQILDALDAAHKKGITHRDLKPGNILMTASGVKLLDFGLAKIGSAIAPPASDASTQTISLTEPGTVLGTAAYMSPEQAKGGEADARSDIFSFGVVLYEMLSGHRAFPQNSAIEAMAAIVRDEPAPLNAPSKLSAVVSRCLAKLPSSRFQTIKEVRAALEQATAVRAEDAPSIAVLPFANMSADKENEYFSDGLAEEILNLLAKIAGLKVIARTSSFAFRGKEQDITQIAGALRVRTILEGSVRRAGSRIRVTAQLIEAQNGSQLWSERYDREMTDIFAIQDEIGQAISEALKVRLAPRTQTVNIEAYQNYLRGQYHYLHLTPESMAKAKDFFEQSLAIDPNYAPAYSGLAEYYFYLTGLGIKPVDDMAPLARSAAEKALAIDPANSLAYSVLAAMAAVFDFDWKAAGKHFRQAMLAEPVPPMVRLRYALNYLVPSRRILDAMEQIRLALETDPLSMPLHLCMVLCMYFAKQFLEAIEYARRALEIDANYYLIWNAMGLAQLGAGFKEEAITSLKRVAELAPWFSDGAWYLATAYYQSGDHERSHEWTRKQASSFGHTYGPAIYYAASGEVDAMFEALEGAYRHRDVDLPFIQGQPLFDSWRADPRFQSLLQRMHLA